MEASASNKILLGDCLKVLTTLEENSVDGVITSPPYNLGKNPNHRRKDQSDVRFYSAYEDSKTPEEYIIWMTKLFTLLEAVVQEDGVVLLNLSYSSKDASLPYRVVTTIEKKTRWKIRDTISWKKSSAIPFQTSPRNMSRIVELVFVFAQVDTFLTNKSVKKVNERTGQKFYSYMDNFVEAPCADKGMRKEHKATYSTEFAKRLIEMYFPPGSIILDPFCGVGTTGNACNQTGRGYVMIDIDPKYIALSKKRLIDQYKEKEHVEEEEEEEKKRHVSKKRKVKRTPFKEKKI